VFAIPLQRKESEELDKLDETVEKDLAQTSPKSTDAPQSQMMMDFNTIAEKAARAAQSAIRGFDMNQAAAAPQFQIENQPQQMQPTPSQPSDFQYHFANQPIPTDYYHESPYQHVPAMHHQMNHQSTDMNNQLDIYGDQNNIPCQIVPTHALYERARMAETAKASPSTRRAGHPSQRRPWSTQEEAALLDGLDRVKGPHWSQILAMYGAGGSVSEALKDRNQVQLKDKARNFKLYFLKNNIQLPYSLSLVTGELRTRAPAQAAKNEAEERERLSEEQGYVEGAMTLAIGGGQDSGHGMDGAAGDDGDGEHHRGYDEHHDRNQIKTDHQTDNVTENADETSMYNTQQPRPETHNDMQYDLNQNGQSEILETYLGTSSSANNQKSTKRNRLIST
jgi:protein TBF1